MKKLNFIVLSALLSVMAFSASASQLVKTFDGGAARCQEGADIGTRAYQLILLNESNTNTHKKLDFKVRLFACGIDIKFREIKLNDLVAQPVLNVETNTLGTIYTKLTKSKLMAYTEMGEVFGQAQLEENEKGEILTSITIPHLKMPSQLVLNLESVFVVRSVEGAELMRGPMVAATYLLNIK